MSKLTSIVIPTCNGREWLVNCLYSVREHTQTPYEIIVVDNGSTDGTHELMRNERIIFVSSTVNRGFPAACNLGMRLSRGDTVLLLNDDVMVGPGWLDRMLACLYREEGIGMVGPMTNYASGRQQTDLPYTTLKEMAELFQRDHADQQVEVRRLVGFCLLMKRELLNTVGLLDEQFSPGHYEDDDLCYRARLAGYRLMIAMDSFVYHRGSASFSKQGDEALGKLLEINKWKFMEKWQVDPASLIDPAG
jgi:GT2 family glycosyltransferase